MVVTSKYLYNILAKEVDGQEIAENINIFLKEIEQSRHKLIPNRFYAKHMQSTCIE